MDLELLEMNYSRCKCISVFIVIKYHKLGVDGKF